MSQPAGNRKELLGMIDGLIKKSSARKRADEGDLEGATSHPVGNADDGTEAAVEGARAQENAEDVRDSIAAETVDDSGNLIGDTTPQGDKITQLDADEAPSTDVKMTKDDPGSAHPSGDPEKTASASAIARKVLANIAMLNVPGVKKRAEEACDTKEEDKESETAEGSEVDGEPTEAEKEAAYAGFNLGNQVVDQIINANKTKAEGIAKQAASDAHLFVSYRKGIELSKLSKRSEEIPPEVLASVLAEQGDMQGEDEDGADAAEAGGEEEALGLGGGDEASAVMDEMAGGDDAAGSVDEGTDPEIEALVQQLAEAGIDPAELAQASESGLQEQGIDVEAAAKDLQKKASMAQYRQILYNTKRIAKAYGKSKK